MKIRFWILPAALAAVSAFAVETKTWTQSDSAEFEKGKLKGLALSSDGRLSLAPTWKEIYDAAVPHLWCAVANAKGDVFTAGADGKVFAIDAHDAQGKGRTLATLEGGAVYALALGPKNDLYAAVSPEAKIYRIDSAGKATLFSSLKAGYVWALVPAAGGGFYAATGNPGQIQKIGTDGKATVFFDAGETHVRSLTLDGKGNLIAGTEPGGLVLRVGADGTGFVLYQTAKREVTAVVAGPDGAIYAAASGLRSATPIVTPAAPTPAPAPAPAPAPTGGGVQIQVGGAARPQATPPSIGVASTPGSSEIYRIAADGEPRRIWSNALLTVYALAFDKSGKLVAGTGNQGRIYRIDTDFLSTRLADGEPQQITALTAGPGGSILAVTANPAKVFQLGPTLEKTGSIESELFDAGGFTYWGRLRHEADLNGGHIVLEAHSGNLDRAEKNWSPWAVIDEVKGARVTAPPARFLSWRATLTAAPDGRSPVLKLVEAAYQAKNVAPVLEALEVTPANYKFPSPSSSSLTASSSLPLPPMGQARRATASSATDTGTGAATLSYEKGTLGARWRAHDANGDTLEYKVEIRGAEEREWKLLKDKVKDARLNWDSTGFADGRYKLRVTASDDTDNYPGQGLSTQMESEELVIDNTPPQVEGLAARVEGSHLRVQFKAVDALTAVQFAEYSVNGGPWISAPPTTRMTDSQSHEYNVEAEKPAGTEFTVAVKVADENDNVTVRKVTLH